MSHATQWKWQLSKSKNKIKQKNKPTKQKTNNNFSWEYGVSKRSPEWLLAGMKTNTTTLENSMNFPQKSERRTDMWSSSPLPDIF
jgi:hypothetical protein